ncbi:CsbD-like protein [Streptococcus pneumoniae]|nr:CsbD family protein [Streptococcus pneumoniae]MDS8738173.1 CsbD family protein [Streptococcus pneumoniae]VJS37928.1 CsbD-like protein [Streptococcus pneumoniae]VKO95846.1 CsbD-like protein [Streptococcus pneumoniae]VNV27091.1 CsbD-like protein [Streptococcus pneumoniae]
MSLENKLEQATGAVKEGFGKVTGDSKTEAEGAVEKTVAKAKDVVEDAKGAVEGLKNVLLNNRKKSRVSFSLDFFYSYK